MYFFKFQLNFKFRKSEFIQNLQSPYLFFDKNRKSKLDTSFNFYGILMLKLKLEKDIKRFILQV